MRDVCMYVRGTVYTVHSMKLEAGTATGLEDTRTVVREQLPSLFIVSTICQILSKMPPTIPKASKTCLENALIS